MVSPPNEHKQRPNANDLRCGAKSYNTNLASELYVLSALHRLGLDAVLTLGNKKSVHLSVRTPAPSHCDFAAGIEG